MSLTGAGELAGDPGSLDFLRHAVEHSVKGIVFAGLDGRISWANASFLRMWGYTDAAELRGVHGRDLVQSPSGLDAILATALERGVWVGQIAARKRNGEVLEVEAVGTLVRDGAGHRLGIMASVIDLTERRHEKDAFHASEAASRASADRLAQAVRVAEIGIFEHDHLRDVVYWSPRMRAIYGYDADEAPTLEKFFACVIPEDHARIRAAVARAHDPTVREKFDVEHRIVRRDGAVRWLRTRSETFFDGPSSQSRPTLTVGAVLDVTEEKRHEAERESLQAQLHQAQKLESVGRLAGGVAHDFNNMLGVVLGYAELVKRRLPDGSPLAEDVDEIASAAMRAREVTRQLLAFSRKQVTDPRPVCLNILIGDTHRALARLIGEDVDVTFLPAEGLWPVKLDPSQVDQIMMNLVVNARDAMPRGGKLTVATANVRIDEEYGRHHPGLSPGDYVLRAVNDDGVGMDAETQARAFEPFFTTKGPGKGTGLGLATVYGIVIQNGGAVNLTSEPERGTTFKLYFPRYHSPAPVAAAKLRDPALTPAHGTVLLVEDEAMVRKVTRAMLQFLGFRVIAAASGAGALIVAADAGTHLDFMLTDVVMPDMGGKALRERVHALRPNLPVVLMSGYTPNVIVHHGVLDDGGPLLQKPFSLGDLARKLAEVAPKT